MQTFLNLMTKMKWAEMNLFDNEQNGNLWLDPEWYKPGLSGLITLHNTYYASTKKCMNKFLEGEWFDHGFFALIDGLLSNGKELRRDAIKPYAVSNYVEKITETPTEQDYQNSREPYIKRLKKLKPESWWLRTNPFG